MELNALCAHKRGQAPNGCDARHISVKQGDLDACTGSMVALIPLGLGLGFRADAGAYFVR